MLVADSARFKAEGSPVVLVDDFRDGRRVRVRPRGSLNVKTARCLAG